MSTSSLTLVLLTAVAAAVLAVVTTTEPGTATRLLGGEHTGRHVRPAGAPRPPHCAPLAHHARPRWDHPAPAAAEQAATTTVPDVRPFTPRTAA